MLVLLVAFVTSAFASQYPFSSKPQHNTTLLGNWTLLGYVEDTLFLQHERNHLEPTNSEHGVYYRMKSLIGSAKDGVALNVSHFDPVPHPLGCRYTFAQSLENRFVLLHPEPTTLCPDAKPIVLQRLASAWATVSVTFEVNHRYHFLASPALLISVSGTKDGRRHHLLEDAPDEYFTYRSSERFDIDQALMLPDGRAVTLHSDRKTMSIYSNITTDKPVLHLQSSQSCVMGGFDLRPDGSLMYTTSACGTSSAFIHLKQLSSPYNDVQFADWDAPFGSSLPRHSYAMVDITVWGSARNSFRPAQCFNYLDATSQYDTVYDHSVLAIRQTGKINGTLTLLSPMPYSRANTSVLWFEVPRTDCEPFWDHTSSTTSTLPLLSSTTTTTAPDISTTAVEQPTSVPSATVLGLQPNATYTLRGNWTLLAVVNNTLFAQRYRLGDSIDVHGLYYHTGTMSYTTDPDDMTLVSSAHNVECEFKHPLERDASYYVLFVCSEVGPVVMRQSDGLWTTVTMDVHNVNSTFLLAGDYFVERMISGKWNYYQPITGRGTAALGSFEVPVYESIHRAQPLPDGSVVVEVQNSTLMVISNIAGSAEGPTPRVLAERVIDGIVASIDLRFDGTLMVATYHDKTLTLLQLDCQSLAVVSQAVLQTSYAITRANYVVVGSTIFGATASESTPATCWNTSFGENDRFWNAQAAHLIPARQPLHQNGALWFRATDHESGSVDFSWTPPTPECEPLPRPHLASTTFKTTTASSSSKGAVSSATTRGSTSAGSSSSSSLATTTTSSTSAPYPNSLSPTATAPHTSTRQSTTSETLAPTPSGFTTSISHTPSPNDTLESTSPNAFSSKQPSISGDSTSVPSRISHSTTPVPLSSSSLPPLESTSSSQPHTTSSDESVLGNKQLLTVMYCSFAVVLLLGIGLGIVYSRWRHLRSAKSGQIYTALDRGEIKDMRQAPDTIALRRDFEEDGDDDEMLLANSDIELAMHRTSQTETDPRPQGSVLESEVGRSVSRGHNVLHVLAAQAELDERHYQTCIIGLQEQSRDIDEYDGHGNTALHTAIACDNMTLMRCLLEAGADPSLRTKETDQTAIAIACQQANITALQLLIEMLDDAQRVWGIATMTCSRGYNALEWCVLVEAQVCFAVLMKLNTTGYSLNNQGISLLHLAAAEGSKAMISMLLSYKIVKSSILACNPQGQTALEISEEQGNRDAIRLLKHAQEKAFSVGETMKEARERLRARMHTYKSRAASAKH
eukprot:m.282669 g.282669  ORF g.282669 m.282669 type:complete len:1248 (+) comp17753_c0_seq2:171-3914(+)